MDKDGIVEESKACRRFGESRALDSLEEEMLLHKYIGSDSSRFPLHSALNASVLRFGLRCSLDPLTMYRWFSVI
jgi:hypothetical protein